jgi:hypothetical protein
MRNTSSALFIHLNSLCKYVGICVLVVTLKCNNLFWVNDTEISKYIKDDEYNKVDELILKNNVMNRTKLWLTRNNLIAYNLPQYVQMYPSCKVTFYIILTGMCI